MMYFAYQRIMTPPPQKKKQISPDNTVMVQNHNNMKNINEKSSLEYKSVCVTADCNHPAPNV